MSRVAKKKQGLGARTEFRISQQSLHFWKGGFVARRRKNGDCLLAHFWCGMTQQSPYPRMRSSLLFRFKKGQSIKNVLGIGCGKIGGQKACSRPLQHSRPSLLPTHTLPA